ncbi:MAG TPA: helix-turn-helix transcriptional regulator [Candidatus Paceibacterota bacterium]
MKYPNRLKEIRKNKGLTLKQVAEIIGKKCVDRLSEWERGKGMPSAINLMTLSKIYNVRSEDIYPSL